MTSDPKPTLAAELERIQRLQPPVEQPEAGGLASMPELADALRLRRSGSWDQSIPSRFVMAKMSDLEGQEPRALERIRSWSVTPQARNLVVGGSLGSGKTHAAVAACREAFFDRGQDVGFWPVVELLDMLRPGGPPDAMQDAMDVDLLILDDLGQERPTDWTAERLYAIVNRRWLEERPVIGTTNLPLTSKVAPEGYTGPTLEEAMGGRTFSRLVGSGAVVLRLAGPDRRR